VTLITIEVRHRPIGQFALEQERNKTFPIWSFDSRKAMGVDDLLELEGLGDDRRQNARRQPVENGPDRRR